ncbi:hypothetical protein J6590_073966 [Homalodisca vitripennis]|nr:hypothetical protein J6590_073966 [Homalodisca vitripennis]
MTSNLLPPHQFLEVLKSVKQVIPPPAKLFLDVKLENLHSFYKFAIIKSYATETQLRVLIKLPLKNYNQEYEVFNVITYPVFDPSQKRWMKWEVDDQKLIISKDKQTYTVYSSDHYRNGYRMPARFFGSSWHSSDFGKITFPEVDGIYSKEETDLLNQDVNDTLKVLQELYDELCTVTERHPEATRTDAELGDLGKSIVPNEQTIRESNQPERECVPERSGIIA